MAASVFFTSAAAEPIADILAGCESLAQVRTLMLVSRRVHSVWLANAPYIIASVGPRAIPAFDTGLMVVRATDLVKQAQLAGHLPPEIDMPTLSSSAQPPSLSELRSVLDLHHLVRCLELQYCQAVEPVCCVLQPGRWPHDRWFNDPHLRQQGPRTPVYPPELGENGLRKWRARFAQAAYMALLIPAVLARAYSLPYAEEPGRSRLHAGQMSAAAAVRLVAAKEDQDDSDGHLLKCGHLRPDDVEYFSGFPAYDLHDKLGRHSEIFGPLADWVVSSRLSALRASGDVPPPCLLRSGCHQPRILKESIQDSKPKVVVYESSEGCVATTHQWPKTGGDIPDHALALHAFTQGSQAEAEHVLWEVMQALHAAEFIYGRLISEARCDWRRWTSLDTRFSLPEEKRCGPKVAVVPFGTFRAEEVRLSTDASDTTMSTTFLLQALPFEPPASQLQYTPDIYSTLESIYMRSGIPNHYSASQEPTPPPPLQFFEFLLEQNFGLAFNPEAFNVWHHDGQEYEAFRHRATIFANGPEDAPDRTWSQCSAGFEILVPQDEREDVVSEGLYCSTGLEWTNPRFFHSH